MPKAASALLICGIIVHYGVRCAAMGRGHPNVRLDNEVYDEVGDSLPHLPDDSEQLTLRGPAHLGLSEDFYSLYYPEKRTERHADGMFNKAYRNVLGQLSARKYLHSLMAKRVGGASALEDDDSEPLSKRHSDGIFTDSYSRYRKQMAVKKYLAAVLGKSPEDVDFHPILQDFNLDGLPDGDELEEILGDLLRQFSPGIPDSLLDQMAEKLAADTSVPPAWSWTFWRPASIKAAALRTRKSDKRGLAASQSEARADP